MLLNVRRLAALDLHGTTGSARRRRLIRAEFIIGAAGCTIERWLELIQFVTDRVEVMQIVVTNASLSGASASGGLQSAKVNLVASLGNDDHAITRRGCSAPGSE
jgi:hypothetical protein